MPVRSIKPEIRPKIHIGIDTRNTALHQGTGIAAYAETLGKICQRIGMQPQFLTADKPANNAIRLVHAILPPKKVKQNFSAPDIYPVAHIRFKIYQRLTNLQMNNPPALMHWTYPLPLRLKNCKNIVTIHDLIPLTNPALTTINGPRLHKLLKLLLARFDGIVTVSETVRAEIINLFDISPSNVQTLYPAADINYQGEPAQPLCPPGSFVVIGSVEPRKNIRALIAAHKASKVTAPLAIIGPDGDNAAAELAGMGDNIIRVPYAPRAALLSAIKQARAVLFPSLAEGFGLPIIEAFASGVPVMTSQTGATEEIAGGAALLVNPRNLDEISGAIQRLAQDDALCARLTALGLARSKVFSLDSYAQRLETYYTHILSTDYPHHAHRR